MAKWVRPLAICLDSAHVLSEVVITSVSIISTVSSGLLVVMNHNRNKVTVKRSQSIERNTM